MMVLSITDDRVKEAGRRKAILGRYYEKISEIG